MGLRRHPGGAPRSRSRPPREAHARGVQQGRPRGRGRRVARIPGGPRGRGDRCRRHRGLDRPGPRQLPRAGRRPAPERGRSRRAARAFGGRRPSDRSDGRRVRHRTRRRRRIPGHRQAHRAHRRPDELRRRGVGRAVPARPLAPWHRRGAPPGRDRRGRPRADRRHRAGVGVQPLGGPVTALAPGALGVFGGTFDPIHQAHLAVAESARDALGLERVLFIPAGQPPHKRQAKVTPAADRLAMVEAAIADNRAFAVSTIELDRPGPSYTVDTLEALAPEATGGLALIVSAEAWADFPTWHRPERIVELATIVVAPRDGYAEPDPAVFSRRFPAASAPAIVLLDGPRMRLSASEIRRRAAAGRSLRYLVPDAVAAYIGDHGLYHDPRRTDRT